MWIWDKITKARVLRTTVELKIQTLAEWKVWVIILGFCALLTVVGSLFDFKEIGLGSFLIGLYLIKFISITMEKSNTEPLFVQGNNLPKLLIPKKVELSNVVFPPPYFIDLQVVSQKRSIKIYISNRGQGLGMFTLKTGDDLTKVIDGLMELLDLELVENIKMSFGELLSFKSKNMLIAPYSAVQIIELNHQLSIQSIPEPSKTITFDFAKKTIQKGRKTFDFTAIEQLLIEKNGYQQQVNLLLKNGKKKSLFKHDTTEINVIRDSKLLKTTLENRQELQGIEIELIEKT